jgi:hypothetical protein
MIYSKEARSNDLLEGELNMQQHNWLAGTKGIT